MICTSGCNYSLCTPDDGCWRHPKHVEWLGSKTNKYCLELHLVGLLNTWIYDTRKYELKMNVPACCLSIIDGGRYVRTWVLKIGSYSSLADLLTWLVFIALFQLALRFSTWQTERFEQSDVVYGALLPLTDATFVLFLHFCPQEVLWWYHWCFIDTEVLLTIRWRPIACHCNNFSSYRVCVLVVKFPNGRN
jgi:hypothetical protein